MAIRKALTSIVLAGALALGSAGCTDYTSQYDYDGKIGEDQVSFRKSSHSFWADYNLLTVKKADGREIKYEDYLREDLKLEYVQITKNGQTVKYTADDETGKRILEGAQEKFDAYMQQIREIKINQALENLE